MSIKQVGKFPNIQGTLIDLYVMPEVTRKNGIPLKKAVKHVKKGIKENCYTRKISLSIVKKVSHYFFFFLMNKKWGVTSQDCF